MSQIQERNRLTCVLNIYHEQHGETPFGERLAVSDELAVNAEAYFRKFTVGEEWVPLDLGWFEPGQVGCVLVENREGTGYQPVRPSDEELLDVSRRILRVGSPEDDEGWLVSPRRFILGHPTDPTALHLRCLHGRARVRTIVYPR